MHKSTHRLWWLYFIFILSVGCSSKKDDKYKISEQTPANYITENRNEEDVVRFDESACQVPAPFSGTAYEYLQVLVETGGRRSGTQGYRCAAAFARDLLKSFGYQVHELEYTFPFYEFDLDSIKVTRVSDNSDFPAYPMHYTMPINGVRQGRVCRPNPFNLTGCFVLLDSGLRRGDVKKKYEKWKEDGAVGMIRDANMRPLGTKGLRHSSRAHRTSWRYTPLPGFVVENAKELVGETIEVKSFTRIVQGTGYSIVAKGPSRSGRYVLVTAHLDCWFTGALDDGSGSAALLKIAEIMKDDNEGLIFLLADTEEIGLIGSAAYVQAMGVDNLDAIIELDMVSTLNNFGRGKSPETAKMMPRFITYTKGLKSTSKDKLNKLEGRMIYFPASFTRNLMGGLATDMEWFYSAGVPGVFIYTPSKYYHTEKDTLEWIRPDDLQEVGVATAELLKDLRNNASNLPQPPRIVPLTFTAEPGEGDTVTFALEPGEHSGPPSMKKPSAAVHAYFEQGYEEKVTLTKDDEGVWRGEFCPPWTGEWQFLAVYSKGKNFGKKWMPLQINRSCKTDKGGK